MTAGDEAQPAIGERALQSRHCGRKGHGLSFKLRMKALTVDDLTICLRCRRLNNCPRIRAEGLDGCQSRGPRFRGEDGIVKMWVPQTGWVRARRCSRALRHGPRRDMPRAGCMGRSAAEE